MLLEDLVRVHYARLVQVLVLSGDDVALAEDAVQEAFARLWREFDRGVVVASPAAWLFTVARNHRRSWWRRRSVEARAVPRLTEVPGTADSDADWSDAISVRGALVQLPRRQREAVVCFYWLGMSVEEAAAATGTSSGTVKNALHRARAAMAVTLSEEVPTDGT